MTKRLVLFSQPSSTVFAKIDVALFPEYLKDRVLAYMPCEGDAVEFNAQFSPLWEEYAEKNHAKLVTIDNSKRGQEAKIEVEKLKSANILIITGGQYLQATKSFEKIWAR